MLPTNINTTIVYRKQESTYNPDVQKSIKVSTIFMMWSMYLIETENV